MADEYTFDEFDDGSGRQVGVFHQEKMRLFLEEYSKQLRNIEEALHESLSDVWDPTMDPVALVVQPYEQASLKDLINTENKLFNKIILVFASLCKEMDYLSDIAEKKFLPTFLLFGQELSQDPTEGDAQIQIGRMMPFLIDLSNYVNRVYSVVMNTVRQVATLYEKSQELYKTSFKDVHLNTLYNKLGSMLTVLITLDEVIMQNIAFRKAWMMYKRMTKDIKAEAARFNTDEEQMLQFEKLLLSIEGQLLEGAIYENCIQQEFDFPGVINVRNNELFEKELLFNVKAIYQRLTSGDLKEIYQRSHYIGLCSLFVFYFVLFRKPADKKFFKAVWDLQQIIPVIHLRGNVVWLPNEFLTKKVAFMVKAAIGKPDTKRFLTEYVANMDRTFINEVNQLYLRTSMWMVRMESNLMNRAEPRNILVARISLINSGIRHAHEIGDLFKQYIYLHSYLGLPLKPSRIRYLCQCVEMLKAIQGTFHRRSAVIGETMSYMIQEISFQLQRTFFPIKDKLEKAKSKYNEQRMDILAAANLCMRMLLGCSTDDRRLVLRLAMHVLFQVSVITDAQIEEIKEKVRDLDNICDLQNIIAKACDCSFFYWSRIMLPTYFSDIFKNAEHAQRLPYMFAGLRDISNIFSRAIHIPSAELHQMFVKDVESSFQQSFMKPLCTEIETDLRFHIHSHLEVQERNPFQNGVRDLSALVAIRPIRFFDQIIDIKNDVGNYLDRKFYDLTTVALYDWKTYAEMRNLAYEKYGISMKEVHLPGQTLEQGVDVLEIMRNIHIFVARYHYNINNQIFIEKQSDSKILNTVNIGHIANSLRTHGAGIMNTTVNFTYQFLRQKFKIFSQFLFDEHIKSRLYKDARFFRENKDQLESRYPFDRAEKFNKEIRKLGLTPNGLTYLDQFRLLITEIGNAMGYIRLVRSGGLQYISNSIKFIPDIQDPPKFSEMTGGLSAPSVAAAQNLDKTVDNLIKNFSTGTDYFKMLVSVIAPEFRNEQNMHLRNFYIIVPPLILNFVDHMLISKEKLKTKKGNQPLSFCFSDDGFSIGLAYILKLLNQYLEFDTLHWFDSVTFRFEAEIERITNQIKAAAPPPAAKGAKPPPKKGPATPSVPSLSEEQQTMLLTKQKSKNFLHEFELFRFSFAGARIFFKD